MVLAVTGEDDTLMLLHSPEGDLVTLSTVCTHRGCDVEFSSTAGHIVCPCHGSEYDGHGAVLKGPAKRPVHADPVRIEANGAVIDLAG